MKKLLRFLGNLLIYMVLIVAIIMTVAVITSSRASRVHLPNLFGYALLTVQSDSMESDSGFFTGDLIVDKILSEEEANALSVGDVITFIRTMDGQEYLETHRIVSCEVDPSVPREEIVDGVWMRGDTRYYVTMGDNTPGVDKFNGGFDVEYTSYNKIYGLWTGIRVPKLGTAMDFLQSSMGFMICIVLPVALFFIYQLYIFIMTLTRRQKEKALEEVSSKEEELRQKAIAEFLAQQQANGVNFAVPDTKSAAPETPAPESESKKKRKNKHVKEETPAEAESAEPVPAQEASPADEPGSDQSDAETEEKSVEETGADEKSNAGIDEENPVKEAESAEPAAAEEETTAEKTESDQSDTETEETAVEETDTDEKSDAGTDEESPAKEAESAEPAAAEEENTPEEAESDQSDAETEETAVEETGADPESEEESSAEGPGSDQSDAETEETAVEETGVDAESDAGQKPDAGSDAAPAGGAPEISEEEKERIIREYLAKQAREQKSEE